MRSAFLSPLAALLAALPAGAQQYTFCELATIDLDSTADPANAEYIGSNPSGIAWNGSDLFVCGFNGGGATGVGIVKVTDALGAAGLGSAFGFVAGTPGSRGYSGLDISGDKLAAAYDDGASDPLGIQAFGLDGTQLWAADGRGGSGVAFDPGFPGGDPALGSGVAWATFGSGRRLLQDADTGATIYDSSSGMVIFTSQGTFWRDLDFDDATGDIWLREGNNVIVGTRSGDNSLAGLTVVVDADPDADFVPGNNLAYLANPAGDVVIYGDRSGTGLGQSFFDVVRVIDPAGAPVSVDWMGFAPATSAGFYDFSWDAASETLAVLDFTNRNAHVFKLIGPGLGQSFCETSPNSVGAGALMAPTGSNSLVANDLVLVAGGLPAGQFGVFYYGAQSGSVPFGNGLRCVTGSVTRLPVVAADGSGTLSFAVDNTALLPGGEFVLCETTYFQAWYRDPAGGGSAFNLSDGFRITWLP